MDRSRSIYCCRQIDFELYSSSLCHHRLLTASAHARTKVVQFPSFPSVRPNFEKKANQLWRSFYSPLIDLKLDFFLFSSFSAQHFCIPTYYDRQVLSCSFSRLDQCRHFPFFPLVSAALGFLFYNALCNKKLAVIKKFFSPFPSLSFLL